MDRFYISQINIQGNIALLSEKETHHILTVLRLSRGMEIELFDGQGRSYQGKILCTQGKQLKVKISRTNKQQQINKLEITLVQAIPRKNRMDYIVEKCTELGVDLIIPTQTARTIVRLKRDREAKRRMRWQRIAQEASRQSGRDRIPQIEELTSWKYLLSTIKDYDLKLLFCLNGNIQKIKDILHNHNLARKVILFIGPEGDFTPQEVQEACSAGCTAVSLGKGILKTDTAAISALAAINYELR